MGRERVEVKGSRAVQVQEGDSTTAAKRVLKAERRRLSLEIAAGRQRDCGTGRGSKGATNARSGRENNTFV